MGLRVAVVKGGASSEAEVSRASAAAALAALQVAGHAAVGVELEPVALTALQTGFDVVFPVCHGAVGEDGCLQGLLEVLGLPYVGSGVAASAMAMNKALARIVFADAGLPVARGMVLRPSGSSLAAAAEARLRVGRRLVVKPVASGSAIGVSRFDNAEDAAVARAIDEAFAYGDGVLVEHFARGREVTCGVLERNGGPPAALPPTEIVAQADAFYTYEARYQPGRSVHHCPAPLSESLRGRVARLAEAAHRALGCRDLSRVDMIVGDDDDAEAITLLEVNTIPGFTGTSLYPEAAAVAGIPFATLCDELVVNAYRRGPSPRNTPRPMP